MKVALIGRTGWLLETGRKLYECGHIITLVITAPSESFYGVTEEDYKTFASTVGAVFINNIKLNSSAGQQYLAKSAADIGVSVNWPSVIGQDACNSLPLGILNAHAGDLPRYRGNACPNWAIISGEEKVGLCIHKMVGGELDSGDILARDYHPLTLDTKVTEIWDWMNLRVPELFIEALSLLENNPNFVLERQSKNPKDALRCYPRIPEDSRINWSNRAIDVLRLINASTKPYSGAFCNFEGKKLMIWDAHLVDDHEIYLAVPGQITKIGDDYVEVATGEGKLRLVEVECNQMVMKPSDLIRSIRVRLT